MKRKKVACIIICIIVGIFIVIECRNIYLRFTYNPKNYDDYYETELMTYNSNEKKQATKKDYFLQNLDNMLDNIDWQDENAKETAKQRILELYNVEE